jgi:hypothetical protein
MTDMQTQDKAVTGAGSTQTGVNRTVQTTSDPVTGASTRQSTTRAWTGKAPGIEFVWLIAGILIAFLALDFVFHAAGANNVGFAAFVFSVGKVLASPFAGIFRNSTAHGNLVIWADVLAIVIYALVAAVIAKLVTMAMARSATSSI